MYEPPPKPVEIGAYRNYSFCRFCFKRKIVPVIDLGNVPLAGGFVRKPKEIQNEKFFPLELGFCSNCFLLQSLNVINKRLLFENYFYFSSKIKTLTGFFLERAKEMKKIFPESKKIFIVEVGSNDGSFLTYLSKFGFRILGVDPAQNVVRGLKLPVINDYFTEKTARRIVKKYGEADVVASFNTMAHIENMHDVINGIKLLLKDNGFLFFSVHYLGDLIAQNQYDMIYHEHQYYYSILTLVNFFAGQDMEIFDVKRNALHGGSIIVYVQKKEGTRIIHPRVKRMIRQEKMKKFDNPGTYQNLMRKIVKSKIELLAVLWKLKNRNKKIAGYGASGRGTIIMNYCGLGKNVLEYVIDDSPIKQKTFTPGTHLNIVSSSLLERKNRPDYILLFAWSFYEEIKRRNRKYVKTGGTFIVPLPKVKILT